MKKYLRLEASLVEGSGIGAVNEEISKAMADDSDDNHNNPGKRKADDGKALQGQNVYE